MIFDKTVEVHNLGLAYPDLIHTVVEEGELVQSRAGLTAEVLNFRLELSNPAYCVVSRAGFSEEFMREEILQLLAGKYDRERLAAVVPRAAEMITPVTSYGPRTGNQLRHVERELKDEPFSRRAVVYVGRPDDLANVRSPAVSARMAAEMPCTCVWQFHARPPFVESAAQDVQLHMSVYMRSWDLVWGLSYDIPSFVAVQMMMADALDLKLGTYTHTAGSGHVYERHFDIETKEESSRLDISPILRGSVAATQTYARELMKR